MTANKSTTTWATAVSGTYVVDKASLANNVSLWLDGDRDNKSSGFTNSGGVARSFVVNATFNGSGASDLILHIYLNDTNNTHQNNSNIY